VVEQGATSPLFSLLFPSFKCFDADSIPKPHRFHGFSPHDESRAHGLPSLDEEQLSDLPAFPEDNAGHSLSQTGSKTRTNEQEVRAIRAFKRNHRENRRSGVSLNYTQKTKRESEAQKDVRDGEVGNHVNAIRLPYGSSHRAP